MSLSPDFTWYLILHTGVFPEVDTNFETHFYSFVRLFVSSVSYPAFGIPGNQNSGSTFPVQDFRVQSLAKKKVRERTVSVCIMLHEIRWTNVQRSANLSHNKCCVAN